MKIKKIIENIPTISLIDMDYQQDYIDGMLVHEGVEKRELHILDSIYIDVTIVVKKVVQVFAADAIHPSESEEQVSIGFDELILWEEESERKISIQTYNRLLKEIKSNIVI